MASSSCTSANFFFVFWVLALTSLSYAEGQMVPAVFVFGDSLVDVGNNNYLPLSLAKANFPHNGVDFPTRKPTGRFSNGKNAADFLAEKVGLPTSPPYLSLKSNKNKTALFLTGVNFASGGAGIFNGSDEALHQSIPLTAQVEYYVTVYQALEQGLGSSSARQHLAKSLFLIVIGSNDLSDNSEKSNLPNSTPQQHFDLMAATLKIQLKKLYHYGARKFALTGLGPTGCTPAARKKSHTEECNEETNNRASMYNEVLKSMLAALSGELKGISYSYFDTYNFMLNALNNPANYGFKEVKSACCGLGKLKAEVPCVPISTYCFNRSDHIFWDLYHPTQAAARIFVDTFFDGPSQYTFPVNVRHLVSV